MYPNAIPNQPSPPSYANPPIQPPPLSADPYLANNHDPVELSTPVDEDSWRYSKLALPFLLLCLAFLLAVLMLTFWQQAGDIKRQFDGVPRVIELREVSDSDTEAGQLKSLRSLRCAYVVIAGVAVAGAFFVFMMRPKLKARKGANMGFAALLIVAAVLAWIAFGLGLKDYDDAVACPAMNRWTGARCRDRTAYSVAAVCLDAALGFIAIVAAILLAYNTARGHWRMPPRDWEEAVADSGEQVKERLPGDRPMRNVGYVRRWITGLGLFAVLVIAAGAAVFVVLLHEGRQQELLYGLRGRADASSAESQLVSTMPFEHAGWPTRNTRLRYAASAVGILAVLFNFLPFRSKTLAYVFGFLYFASAVMLFVAFGFDVHEVAEAGDLDCSRTVDNLELDCSQGSFVATIVLEFLAAFLLLVYLVLEYALGKKKQCQHCDRAYEMHALIKHEAVDCPVRPVRCEVCAQPMLSNEFAKHRQTCSLDHVKCPHCKVMISKTEGKDHQDQCPQCPVACGMCQMPIQRAELPHHAPLCANRPSPCPACGETFRCNDLDAHQAVCGEVMVRCAQCEDHIQRFRIQQHEQYDCPRQLVACMFCAETLPRFRLARHNAECHA
eukprot:NODE_589_length_2043_cov_112.487474_g547_i0.p1 GENE.NODE_589_length_2043_cov_112.487474_g547_i0~~NODE_589_length_2043_cov_112.487474_g547_i0.p1  ORF type:complete len:611 (-),score=98.56 NODE_589_length_2043_cov_112.487474_g547_i0:139-1971(-)